MDSLSLLYKFLLRSSHSATSCPGKKKKKFESGHFNLWQPNFVCSVILWENLNATALSLHLSCNIELWPSLEVLPCLFTHFWQNKPLFILAVTIYLSNRGDMKAGAPCGFLYCLTDCHVQHHTLVIEDWRVRVRRGLVCVCAHSRSLPSEKHKTPSWVLKTMHILISLIIHPYVTDERILVSVSGTGNMRGGWQKGGEGHSSKPKWLCSCRSLNLPLCTAPGEMRHSPGLAPVMWRGIREMNVFRISNNQRIISTPSAFKSMDPSRLKRHFDWESKSSLPLDTKDNEVAAFPLLSFYCHRHVWGRLSAESHLSKSIISSADWIHFIVFFLLSYTKLWANQS